MIHNAKWINKRRLNTEYAIYYVEFEIVIALGAVRFGANYGHSSNTC